MTDREQDISRMLHLTWDAFKDLPRGTVTLEDQEAFKDAIFGAQIILNRIAARSEEALHHEPS